MLRSARSSGDRIDEWISSAVYAQEEGFYDTKRSQRLRPTRETFRVVGSAAVRQRGSARGTDW